MESYHSQYLKRASRKRLISSAPDPNLMMVVVIPCFNEPDLLGTLQNLFQCDHPLGRTEVIVVINSSLSSPKGVQEQNQKSLEEVSHWLNTATNKWLTIHLLHIPNLPQKNAGVGLARKIGMDEAIRRLVDVKAEENGIVICYDADCRCSPNYLTSIEKHFLESPKTPGTSIYFEHPLNDHEMVKSGFGKLKESINQDEFEGISAYELHLRYHVRAQKHINFPYAFQTIGSAMAVRAWAYIKQGGMNQRQAGEDFYFLQKISWLGKVTELQTSTVYPSPRISDRVPFGTGKAISNYIGSKQQETYPIQAYRDVQWLIHQIDWLWEYGHFKAPAAAPLAIFLGEKFLKEIIPEIRQNSTDSQKFRKRFFRWFNAFRLMKYLNIAKDKFYGSNKVESAAQELLKEIGYQKKHENIIDLLKKYRQLDRDSFKPSEFQTNKSTTH